MLDTSRNRSSKRCSRTLVCEIPLKSLVFADKCIPANSFTPWFKLIARDLLYPWWDEMLAKSRKEGWDPESGEDEVRASLLKGSGREGEVIKMV